MDNDDAPVGRFLSRREILTLFGGAGAVLIVGACSDGKAVGAGATATTSGSAAPASAATSGATSAATSGAAAAATANPATAVTAQCVVSPALTEGPYFVDEKLNRGDIRSDSKTGKVSEGTPLVLTFQVGAAASNRCSALANAMVDVWHCDAAGVYSDASDPSFNTKGQNFLRGQQLTDASGKAVFTTIFPGWYQGRAVHIHFKIRGTKANGQSYEFTSQLFFTDAQSIEAYQVAPYKAKGNPNMKNAQDGIYNQSGGKTVLAVTKTATGYAGTFAIGLTAV
jgi:protocatechuate 3,4-dioxygenase beta subunit